MQGRLPLYSLVILMLTFGSISGQSVTGTIKDNTGEPLPGASVTVKDQPGIGAVANADGEYVLNGFKPGKITLIFSFIGFETKNLSIEINGSDQKELNLILLEEENELDEIVVVGYGVQRRREVTGSVVKLSGKELNDMPAPSFEAALQGKAPGVQVTTGSGLAGSPSVVRVRGIASIGAGGDPLYIIDGVQINQDYFAGSSIRGADAGGMNQNPLAFLNPEDIESMEILKDASATAIYGSRGANGVIIITTKRGSSKKLRFNFSTTQGISQPTKRPEMLNSQQWLQLYEEAWVNDGNVGTPTGLPGGLTWEQAQQNNTDWVDLTIRNGYKQFYDFSAEKGSDKYNFYAGISYDANQSYLIGDQYNRLSGRFNGDYKFSDKFTASLSTSLTRAIYNRVDNGHSGGLGAAMSSALPIFPLYHDKDVYQVDQTTGDSTLQFREGDYWFLAGANNNPVGIREQKQWQNRELRSVNNIRLNYTPIKNLTLSANGSVDISDAREDIFEPAGIGTYIGVNDVLESGIAKAWPRRSVNYNVYGTASYTYDLNDDNKFTFLLGTEFQETKTKTKQHIVPPADPTGNNTYTNEFYPATGFLDDANYFDTTRLEYQVKFASVFTRINYTFKGKYLLQGVLRTDGSSNFGPDNKYGFFPSISGGWIISDEDFLKNSNVLNYLKLKSSIGYIGNAGVGSNNFLQRFKVEGNYDNQGIRFPINAENPNLKWETTQVFDLGVEFGFFGDRITGELAYYHKNTSDVLMSVTLPRINGFTTYADNVGGVLNYGLEAKLSTVNVSSANFSWRTDFNIAFNRNRITSLGGYSEDAVAGGTNDTRIVEGGSVGTFYMVPVVGVDSETGLPLYATPEGGTTTTYSQDLRVPVGKGIPDAIGGLNNTFTYKNWSLSTLLVFSIGADVYNHSGKYQQTGWPNGGTYWNLTPRVYDRWVKPGDETTLPRLTLNRSTYPGLEVDYWNTNLWVEDASYLRVRNITLGYNVKRAFVDRIGLSSLSVSFVGTNLFTFTKFSGLDPEVARDFADVTDRNMSVNTTYLTAPQEKTYSVRINASF